MKFLFLKVNLKMEKYIPFFSLCKGENSYRLRINEKFAHVVHSIFDKAFFGFHIYSTRL